MGILGARYTKADRVRKSAEIETVFRRGIRYSCKGMRLHVMPNTLGITRVVLVPVRAYPSSVARNLARRLLRECWRLDKMRMACGFDVAVVLYPGSDTFAERRSQLRRLLGQAGILTPPR
jgi:ribonuclease P protein component